MESVRAAVASWKLRHIRTDGDFFGHYHDLVSEAHQEGAEVAIFPENHSLELLGLATDLDEKNVPKFLSQFAKEIEAWTQRIADSSGLIIVGGSYLKELEGKFENICPIAVPGHALTLLSKNRLTRYEREIWKLSPGKFIALPEMEWLGALICYDIEFPESVRSIVEKGVLIAANPTFTETQYGFNRIRNTGLARATENQIFVLQASLVGSLDREPVPCTFGSSAILCPSIEPYPPGGVLDETAFQEEQVLVRTLNLNQLLEARERGDVQNWNDRHPLIWKAETSNLKDPKA